MTVMIHETIQETRKKLDERQIQRVMLEAQKGIVAGIKSGIHKAFWQEQRERFEAQYGYDPAK